MTATQSAPLSPATPALDVQIEVLGQVRRRLRFDIPKPAVAQGFAATSLKYANKVRVPGFRPGKAPAAMMERMYGQEIRRAVTEDLLKIWVFKAIQATDLKPVGRPEVESVGELNRDKAFSVVVICEVLPELTLTGYEGAALSVAPVVADDADLEAALEAKARERSEQVAVESDLQNGDDVDASWTILPEGAEEPTASETKRHFVLGAPFVPFEVAELLPTAKVGEEIVVDRAAEGTLPARKVTLTVHEANRTVIPAIDDELAKDLGHADLAALKAAVQAELAAEVAKLNLDNKRNAAVDAILAANVVEVPQSFTDELVDQQLAQSFGHLDEKTLRSLGGFFQQMRKDMRRNTESALRRGIVLDALADKLEIAVEDAEIDAKLADLLAQNPSRAERTKREFQGDSGRDELRRRVRTDKAQDELVKLATWTELEAQTLRAAKAPKQELPEGLDDEHDHDHDHDHGAEGHVHDENCNHDH